MDIKNFNKEHDYLNKTAKIKDVIAYTNGIKYTLDTEIKYLTKNFEDIKENLDKDLLLNKIKNIEMQLTQLQNSHYALYERFVSIYGYK